MKRMVVWGREGGYKRRGWQVRGVRVDGQIVDAFVRCVGYNCKAESTEMSANQPNFECFTSAARGLEIWKSGITPLPVPLFTLALFSLSSLVQLNATMKPALIKSIMIFAQSLQPHRSYQ